jgi:hypothetical protein
MDTMSAMSPNGAIDTTTDFQDDSGRRDPDLYSPLLQSYHQRLWSKRLPGGELFELTMEKVGSARVLRHQSERGHFVLSSDTLANSSRGPCRTFYEQMGPEVNVAWHRDGGTIGGRLVFPRNRIEGKQTINQIRGTSARIRDRFDLTLEAIRRHYSGELSPLSETLQRYGDFFALFEDFQGYVDFFLLQDLVVDGGKGVRFYLPFEGFESSPLPKTMESYRQFREKQLDFVASRNRRIVLE